MREIMINRAQTKSTGRAAQVARTLFCVCGLGLASVLQGCGSTRIDRHGHVFTDVDLQQVQSGMSKDQVRQTLGTPDTTSSLGGDAYYYISSTRRTRPASRPVVIDRKILAVYFDQQQQVAQVANYGLKDGVIFDFIKGETPSRGKQLTALEQLFGNITNRRSIIGNTGSQDSPY
ncbi:MAG: outer membrane protein assembly factor BamE [Hyphomicrobiales bacterium]|nr:outer membrane protein assembly factor BamE [Hyphomicrobiales bacterium]